MDVNCGAACCCGKKWNKNEAAAAALEILMLGLSDGNITAAGE